MYTYTFQVKELKRMKIMGLDMDGKAATCMYGEGILLLGIY